MTIGEFINNYLTEHSMSQRQFAKRCNLSNGYISMLINNVNPRTGKPLVPSLSAVLSISGGMGITIDELIEKTEDTPVDISVTKNMPIASKSDGRQDIISYQESFTSHEMRLIEAYRKNPHMQAAVNTLLGITDEEVYIPVAARSGKSGTVKATNSKAIQDALDEILPEVNTPKKPDEF